LNKKIFFSILKVIVFLGLGIFFIWLFVRKLTNEQIEDIFISVKNVNLWWLLLSFVIGIISHFARAARSKIMFEPLGYKISLQNSFYAVMVGYLANLAVPRLGEVLRCSFLSRYENVPIQKSFGTIIAERVIDMIIFVLLLFLAFIIEFDLINNYFNTKIIAPIIIKFGNIFGSFLLYAFIALLVLLFIILKFFKNRLNQSKLYLKLKNVIKGLWEGILSVSKVKKMRLFILYTILIWLSYYLMVLVVFYAFDGLGHLTPMTALSCLVFGSVAFMIVQGGIGLYPAIIAETLGLYGVSFTLGYAAGWIGWSVQQIMIIILGLLSLILASLFRKKNGKITTNQEQNNTNR